MEKWLVDKENFKETGNNGKCGKRGGIFFPGSPGGTGNFFPSEV